MASDGQAASLQHFASPAPNYDDGLVAVLEEMVLTTDREDDNARVAPEPAATLEPWPQPSPELSVT